MRYLWKNRIFWFFVITTVLYFYVAPMQIIIAGKRESIISMFWAPYYLTIILFITISFFLIVHYYQNSKIALFVFRVKKVFKIIFISLLGFLIMWLLMLFLMTNIINVSIENSDSFQAGLKFIKQDTIITNIIGKITGYNNLGYYKSSSYFAKYHYTVNGIKLKADVEIQLIRKQDWYVDSVKYEIK